jgi:hypothetical protein
MGQTRRYFWLATILAGLTAYACGTNGGGFERRDPDILSGRGTEVPDLVAEFQTRLGADNGGVPERGFTGRREVNWDSVPDEDAAPGLLNPDFFNGRTEPLARGLRLTTPGNGVQVSADSDNPTGTPVRFGHINANYPLQFGTFSPERLFSPIGSNVVDITFSVAGSPEVPALTRGFGAVYTDVDETGSSFELFAEDGESLGEYFVPTNDQGLSFLGIVFEDAVVARVRIKYGSTALGPSDSATVDVAVMDDFIYGEPQPQD